ncbi:MAG: HWE histidine kinase domain-containing protein [Aliidongia sp.]
MAYFRGLRARILLVLFMAVVPIFALAMLWSAESDRDLQRFRYAAAEAALGGAAERFDRLADRAAAIRAAVAGTGPCAALDAAVNPTSGFDAGLLTTGSGIHCTAGDATLAVAPADSRRQGDDLTVIAVGGGDGPLAFEARLPGDPASRLILRLSSAETERVLDPEASPFLDGLALFAGTHPVAERHASSVSASWWSADGPPVQNDDVQADYVAAPLSVDASLQLVGLRARPFLGIDRGRLWTSIIELSAVLLAIVGGSLWVIDRSVLRWVIYLRRIAVAHSRGHHSVRARRLDEAPKELADLGESLNLMANDAGSRVELLRQSAADKSALLLELHHRVKNNFQVITSLLSLLRWEMQGPRRPEFRLVEDFVRAMAIAYRVAYDSGDVTGVICQDLIRSTAEALRDLAGIPPGRLVLELDDQSLWIPLDKAISLGLYLAVTLPPFFDGAMNQFGATVTLSAVADMSAGSLRVGIGGVAPLATEEPPLQRRLRSAYLRQLKAETDPLAEGIAISIPLGDDSNDRHPAIGPSVTRSAGGGDTAGIFQNFEQCVVGAGISLSSQDAELRYRWARGAELFGRVAGTIVGLTDEALLPPGAAATMKRIKSQVLADGEPAVGIAQLGEIGADERWFSVHVQPLRDGDRNIVGILNTCYEVTSYKAAERRMSVMMREMAHRSKNVLAVTEAMARQTLAHSETLEDFGESFSARLHSLAGSHDLLTKRDWEGASLRDVLRSQLGHYLQAMRRKSRPTGRNSF